MNRIWSASTTADMRKALWFSWVVIAGIGGVLVVSPYLLAQSSIQQLIGICPAKAAGDECSLCGMTTAFYLITRGHFDEASIVNSASVPLYSGLVINCAAGVVDAMKRWRQSPRK